MHRVGDRVVDTSTKERGTVESLRRTLGVTSVVVRFEGKQSPVAYIGDGAKVLQSLTK